MFQQINYKGGVSTFPFFNPLKIHHMSFSFEGLTMKEQHLFNCAAEIELLFVKDYGQSKYLLINKENIRIAETRSLKEIYTAVRLYRKNVAPKKYWKSRMIIVHKRA